MKDEVLCNLRLSKAFASQVTLSKCRAISAYPWGRGVNVEDGGVPTYLQGYVVPPTDSERVAHSGARFHLFMAKYDRAYRGFRISRQGSDIWLRAEKFSRHLIIPLTN
jgi:hypothetical protein